MKPTQLCVPPVHTPIAKNAACKVSSVARTVPLSCLNIACMGLLAPLLLCKVKQSSTLTCVDKPLRNYSVALLLSCITSLCERVLPYGIVRFALAG